MSLRELGWMLCLVGLPVSHLLNRSLDLWQVQGLWAQVWCVSLFASSLGATGRAWRPNRPLAALTIWIGLFSFSTWITVVSTRKLYPLGMLQSLMHVVILLMAYVAATTTWTAAFLHKLLRGMAWMGVLLLGYCLLQLLSLDQFFHDLDTGISKDQLVGTIGNPSHLASQLALLLGLFLLQPGWFWRGCAVVCVGIALLTKSIGGQLSVFAVLLWWAWHRQRKGFLPLLACGVLTGIYGCLHMDALNPHGRWAAWSAFYQIFATHPITGMGLGYIMELSRIVTSGPIFQWRHAHNEYLQLALELGVVGLGCVLWMMKELIVDIWRMEKTPLVVALSGMLLAFGLNSAVNFPAHLWVTGSYALVGYCGLRVLRTEVV